MVNFHEQQIWQDAYVVLMESMACGMPVIASRVGGMQWTVKDDIERVKHFFSWKKVGSQMSNFYNDFIIEYFYRQLHTKYNDNITNRIRV